MHKLYGCVSVTLTSSQWECWLEKERDGGEIQSKMILFHLPFISSWPGSLVQWDLFHAFPCQKSVPGCNTPLLSFIYIYNIKKKQYLLRIILYQFYNLVLSCWPDSLFSVLLLKEKKNLRGGEFKCHLGIVCCPRK